jgi:chromosome segregation ATPase
MGKAASDRGTQVIIRHIDGDFLREEAGAQRMFDKLTRAGEKLEARNQELETELGAAKAELERARAAYHRRTAERDVLKEELQSAKQSADYYRQFCADMLRCLEDERRGHQKLAAVMKLALTPEQYHQYRAAAADIYPELFEKG